MVRTTLNTRAALIAMRACRHYVCQTYLRPARSRLGRDTKGHGPV